VRDEYKMVETVEVSIAGDVATIEKNMQKMGMEFIESKLNKSLYIAWNRKYIGYLFWNHIGTPINRTITLLTALTAGGQASSFLTEQAVISIQLTVLVISAINTFFRPYVKASEHLKFILEIQKFGTQFDELYYTPKGGFQAPDYIASAESYKKILTEFNKYISENSLEYKNMCVDILYIIVIHTIMKTIPPDREWVKINYV
jgi:hypothetical protein